MYLKGQISCDLILSSIHDTSFLNRSKFCHIAIENYSLSDIKIKCHPNLIKSKYRYEDKHNQIIEILY